MDPDQLASEKPADLNLHCFQNIKRNATIEFCQVKHVVHKHELTMTRILSKASGLFEFIDFCLSGMLANRHEYFNCCP